MSPLAAFHGLDVDDLDVRASSVRARLDEARCILAFVELERGDAELVCTLINVADLAVADCMPADPP